MSLPTDDTSPLLEEEPAARPRGWPRLAWCVIAATVAFTVWLQTMRHGPPADDKQQSHTLANALFEGQARYLVGANDMMSGGLPANGANEQPAKPKPDADGAKAPDEAAPGAEARPKAPPADQEENDAPELASAIYSQSLALRPGPVEHRLRFVALAGELAGPQEALLQLDELREDIKREQRTVEPDTAQTLASLEELYGDYAAGRWQAPAVSQEQRQDIRRRLGWFGRLALAPKAGPNQAERKVLLAGAKSTVGLFVGVILGLGLLGLGGFIGLVVLSILCLLGKLRRGLDGRRDHGAVYAETFAVWIVLFLLLSLGLSLLAPKPVLWLQGLAMLLSLLALAWPVWRGVPWRRVREDIGLTWGRRPALEPALGLATYAMAIPMLVIGVALTMILVALTQQGQDGAASAFDTPLSPSHPIVEPLLKAGAWGWWQALLLASVVAPLVEETMFRGVLYRHLREASGGWRYASSVLFSAVFTSFIFAVIHPQGMLALPPLMALALAFTLAREWRGTLIPGMVAHGVSNALVLTLVTELLR